jgi:hypothetical protein
VASCTIRHRTDEWVEVVLSSPTYAGELGKAHSIMLGQLGLEGTVTNDDVYEVIANDEEIVLRARRPKRTDGAPSFLGTVTDSGGGVVTIVVDRDTSSYPRIGEHVRVEASHA